MALNPIVYTEKVVKSFMRYQLTAYPFADERLHRQMRGLLSLDQTRESPLLKGPYISLPRSFRQGAAVENLITEGVFHPHMRQRIPSEITHLYGHQEEAIRAIHVGKTTLISTGTGSGKTECFLYPVISRCLELADEGAPSGICAVLVYPMNALAEDQLGRLRGLLAGTKLRRTPQETGDPKARPLVVQWLSDRGDTTIRQIARKWGVEADDVEEVLEELFAFLRERGFLRPVRFMGSKGNPLPHVSELYQLDADRLRLRGNQGVWRCRSCRRRTTRRTPRERCPPGAAPARSSSCARIRTATTSNCSTKATRCSARRSTRPWSRTTSGSVSRTSSRASPRR